MQCWTAAYDTSLVPGGSDRPRAITELATRHCIIYDMEHTIPAASTRRQGRVRRRRINLPSCDTWPQRIQFTASAAYTTDTKHGNGLKSSHCLHLYGCTTTLTRLMSEPHSKRDDRSGRLRRRRDGRGASPLPTATQLILGPDDSSDRLRRRRGGRGAAPLPTATQLILRHLPGATLLVRRPSRSADVMPKSYRDSRNNEFATRLCAQILVSAS